MNVLLISILLIVLVAITYISINKKSSAKKEKNATNHASESIQKPTQGDCLKSISESEPESKYVPEEPIERISYTTTTGENEFYKMKLKDPQWIELSKKIKARDNYKCVECGSDGGDIVVLESIEDLEPLVKSQDLYKIVKDVFDNKSQFSYESYKTLSSAYCIENFNNRKIHFVSKTPIKELLNKHLYEFSVLKNSTSKNEKKIVISDDLELDKVLCHTYNVFVKKGDEESLSLVIDYIEEGNTNNNIILRHSQFYSNELAFKYQCILTFNSLSIIFPLYSLDKKQALNVHHKVYYENREPWDFEEPYSELITLCHKCHMEAHKHPIPVKRRNSTGSTDASQ